MTTALLLVLAVGLCSALTAAPCTLTATEIDDYLHGKMSPLEGLGADLLEIANQWNIDPRLLVAIAGTETSFGTNLGCNTQFNAWSWFWSGSCSTSSFSSYREAITSVAKGLRLKYINQGRTTIPQIGQKYCASGCQNWVSNTNTFYETELGGDPNDLGCAPECAAASCGSFVACAAPEAGCESPVCVQVAEMGGQCVEGTTPCAGLADCTRSSQCFGGVCAVNTCCGRSVCVPASAFCSSNGPAPQYPGVLGPTIANFQ